MNSSGIETKFNQLLLIFFVGWLVRTIRPSPATRAALSTSIRNVPTHIRYPLRMPLAKDDAAFPKECSLFAGSFFTLFLALPAIRPISQRYLTLPQPRLRMPPAIPLSHRPHWVESLRIWRGQATFLGVFQAGFCFVGCLPRFHNLSITMPSRVVKGNYGICNLHLKQF